MRRIQSFITLGMYIGAQSKDNVACHMCSVVVCSCCWSAWYLLCYGADEERCRYSDLRCSLFNDIDESPLSYANERI